jgi:hypothetical protein
MAQRAALLNKRSAHFPENPPPPQKKVTRFSIQEAGFHVVGGYYYFYEFTAHSRGLYNAEMALVPIGSPPHR